MFYQNNLQIIFSTPKYSILDIFRLQCKNIIIRKFEQNKDNVRVNCLANAIADSYRFVDGGFTYLDTFYQGILNQVYFLMRSTFWKKRIRNPKMELIG